MEEKKNGVISGSLSLTIGLFFILLFVDSAYFTNNLFGDISLHFHNFSYNYCGDFSLFYFSLFIVAGLLFILRYSISSRLFVFIGYFSLLFFIPSFICGVSPDIINAGGIGIKINGLLGNNGVVYKYFFYFIWMSLTFFLLLFPVKEYIAGFILRLIRFEDKASSKRVDSKQKVYKSASTRNTSGGKYSGRNAIPWLSKVVYETHDKRIESPVFPSNDIPVKKFKLKADEENVEVFNEVDTLSDKTLNDIQNENEKTHEFINLHQMDNDEYYKKLKDTWPDEWKAADAKSEISMDELEVMSSVEDNQESEKLSIYDMIEEDTECGDDELSTEDEAVDLSDFEDKKCDSAVCETDDEVDEYQECEEAGDDTVSVEEYCDDEEVKSDSDETGSEEYYNTAIDSIDSDDLKKFVDENMNQYLSSKTVKHEGYQEEYAEDITSDDENYSDESAEAAYFPDKDMLDDVTANYDSAEYRRIENEDAKILENTLAEFGIRAEVCDIIHGPVVTLFKLIPAPGIKLSKIESLSDNLALRLAAQCIRIIAPIPGEKVVGIEVPNKKRELVSFKEVVNNEKFTDNNYEIPIGIGKDIYGNIIVIDLHRMPHVLIAGATGAGKSVCVNGFLSSILFSRSPDDVKLVLIDPKIVELQPYDGIPHLLTPVITDPKNAINALKYLVYEMEERYALLGKIGVRDIREYRKMVKEGKLNFTNMPYIVAFVDEFADLMSTSGKEVEMLFARLTAKARAIGIHLILATQRPSTDVITGLIKSNVPARFAFQVISYMDSRIILDQKGAEKLLGQGDMLYLSPTQPFPIRLQGAYLSKEEVDLIAEHWKGIAEPDYIDIAEILGIDDDDGFTNPGEKSKDPLFDEAVEIVMQTKKASASYLQRRLNIGYNRAARMVEDMESMGIVGPMQGSKPREILGNPDF